MTASVEKAIDVEVPVQTAYNQWTQFEEFPQFMDGVKEVRQLDDTRLHWVAEVGGRRREWDARITEQVPDHVIAWRSEAGEENAGMVQFEPVNGHTRVILRMEYEPSGMMETVGDKAGFVSRQVEGDLKRFKEFIEHRGRETGAWRGSVNN